MTARWLGLCVVAATLAPVCGAMAAGPGEAVVCAADDGAPGPCRMQDRASSDGAHVMVFERGGERHVFAAREQTEWWSGTLDGRPAMGVELNRGHMKISSTDLAHDFEWWYPKDEHGTY